MTCVNEMKDFDVISGKEVDCVQSVWHVGGILAGFTIRFTDSSLLKVDALRDSRGIDASFSGQQNERTRR